MAPALSYTTLLQLSASQSGELRLAIVAHTESGVSSDPVSLTLFVSETTILAQQDHEDSVAPQADVPAGPIDCQLAAQYLADVTIPDGAAVQPSANLTKIWRIRNTSQCDWDSGYTLSFVDGTQMGAPASVPVSPTVQNSVIDIAIPLIAPADSGIYTGTWRMRTPDGRSFGNRLFVVLRVP